MAVHANTTNLPSLNRAQIMRVAWAKFKAKHTGRVGGKMVFLFKVARWDWANCLRSAWAAAKEAARIAAIPAEVKAERIAYLRDQIERLDYLPFGMRVAPRRAAFEAEIQQLAA